MKLLLFLAILCSCAAGYASEKCPHETAFLEDGWVIHSENDFHQILEEKLVEFLPEMGEDLVLDHAEFYLSEFSHDNYLIMWIVIWDRVSTTTDEMWGDVAFSWTDTCRKEFIELRWYDPTTRRKHIVCNPDYVCCLSTKVPLAYNTIF